MRMRTELPDINALMTLARVADEYASELERGPLELYRLQDRWHPSSLLDDDAELQRGPNRGAFGGGLLSGPTNGPLVERWVARHRVALAQRFKKALDANPGYAALNRNAEFRSLLEAFEDAIRTAKPASRLCKASALPRFMTIIADSLAHYSIRARAPGVRTQPTKDTREDAVLRIKQFRVLLGKGLYFVKGAFEAEQSLERLLAELERPHAPNRIRAPRADASAPAREALMRATDELSQHFGESLPAVQRSLARLLGYKNPRATVSR